MLYFEQQEAPLTKREIEQPKEFKMILKRKPIAASQIFMIGLSIILAAAVIAGFVWTQHTIAPPALRLSDWFWKVFVCQCFV
jgi:sterol desaturase/sphingolipid hydroxylase (fatty acid hydroxylase superfamily)